MGNNLGDLLLTALPLVILIGLLWAVSTALRPRDTGVSEAERYQRELASRSAAHQASQIRAALAQRARIEASAQPSQNRSRDARPAPGAQAANSTARGQQPAVLPNGQLSPQLAFELQNLVRGGQKIQAIKVLRQATHSDLMTAKNYIDRL
jgi:ribosomal protein L7/L12